MLQHSIVYNIFHRSSDATLNTSSGVYLVSRKVNAVAGEIVRKKSEPRRDLYTSLLLIGFSKFVKEHLDDEHAKLEMV